MIRVGPDLTISNLAGTGTGFGENFTQSINQSFICNKQNVDGTSRKVKPWLTNAPTTKNKTQKHKKDHVLQASHNANY